MNTQKKPKKKFVIQIGQNKNCKQCVIIYMWPSNVSTHDDHRDGILKFFSLIIFFPFGATF